MASAAHLRQPVWRPPGKLCDRQRPKSARSSGDIFPTLAIAEGPAGGCRSDGFDKARRRSSSSEERSISASSSAQRVDAPDWMQALRIRVLADVKEELKACTSLLRADLVSVANKVTGEMRKGFQGEQGKMETLLQEMARATAASIRPPSPAALREVVSSRQLVACHSQPSELAPVIQSELAPILRAIDAVQERLESIQQSQLQGAWRTQQLGVTEVLRAVGEVQGGLQELQRAQSHVQSSLQSVQESQAEVREGLRGVQREKSEAEGVLQGVRRAQSEAEGLLRGLRQALDDQLEAQSEGMRAQSEGLRGFRQAQSDMQETLGNLRQEQSHELRTQSDAMEGLQTQWQAQSEALEGLRQAQSQVQDDLQLFRKQFENGLAETRELSKQQQAEVVKDNSRKLNDVVNEFTVVAKALKDRADNGPVLKAIGESKLELSASLSGELKAAMEELRESKAAADLAPAHEEHGDSKPMVELTLVREAIGESNLELRRGLTDELGGLKAAVEELRASKAAMDLTPAREEHRESKQVVDLELSPLTDELRALKALVEQLSSSMDHHAGERREPSVNLQQELSSLQKSADNGPVLEAVNAGNRELISSVAHELASLKAVADNRPVLQAVQEGSRNLSMSMVNELRGLRPAVDNSLVLEVVKASHRELTDSFANELSNLRILLDSGPVFEAVQSGTRELSSSLNLSTSISDLVYKVRVLLIGVDRLAQEVKANGMASLNASRVSLNASKASLGESRASLNGSPGSSQDHLKHSMLDVKGVVDLTPAAQTKNTRVAK